MLPPRSLGRARASGRSWCASGTTAIRCSSARSPCQPRGYLSPLSSSHSSGSPLPWVLGTVAQPPELAEPAQYTQHATALRSARRARLQRAVRQLVQKHVHPLAQVIAGEVADLAEQALE